MKIVIKQGTKIDLLGGTLICIMKNIVGGVVQPIGTVIVGGNIYVPGDPAFQKQLLGGDLELDIVGPPTVDSNGNFWITL